MTEVKGEDLLALLIKLLAEQEGVKIKYEVISPPNRGSEADRG